MKSKEERKKEADEEKIDWVRDANMEEILMKAVDEDWRLPEINSYCIFKIAQYLENIDFQISKIKFENL